MRFGVLVISLSLLLASGASAATLELVGDFDQPVFVTSDPGDAGRLLVVERDGLVVEVGPSGTDVFADLTTWVSCCSGERGLWSIAPAPDFSATGRFYAAYAGTTAAGGVEGELHVDVFRPDGEGDPEREPVIAVGHPDDTHYGGQLQLGPDGYLYISVGDGGGAGDPAGNGQDLDTLLGKVLRIDPQPGEVPSYEIPPGNPFAGGGGLEEIWSYGLRNPWRFSFDRLSGDMVIGDVGQNAHEEIDLAPSPAPGVVGGDGANYGWNCREGLFAFPGAPLSCQGLSGFTDPVFDYPHADLGAGGADGCSITGGYVVRDPSLGDLFGRYVYADFCEGHVRSLVLPDSGGGVASGNRSEGLIVASPTSFGEDSSGRIYAASSQGEVYRLIPGPPGPQPSVVAPLATPAGEGPISLRLSRRARDAHDRVRLRARVFPCSAGAGGLVRLRRGGRPVAAKQLGGGCTARFRAHVDSQATFRALLLPGDGGATIRSRRLVVPAAG